MAEVLVVGSGASGVHFALTALERGHRVTMLDVGYPKPEPPLPDATFPELKQQDGDASKYFLGPDGEGVVYPGDSASFYGHPPSKEYVFRTPAEVRHRAIAMAPLFSFARGGFAEAWTAGCYAFSAEDLTAFPIDYADLAPHYREVARRIGVGGTRDDLEPFLPWDADYLPSLPVDAHSAHLLARYAARRARLHDDGFHLGRSRVATLSRDHAGRRACAQLGRCLWGCPVQAIYTPSATLRGCQQHQGFTYLPGRLVRRFEYGADGTVQRVVATGVDGAAAEENFPADVVVLAAGALGSSRIVLESVAHRTGDAPRLAGLMDNRQIHMPFLTPALLGTPPALAAYQFHHLAFALRAEDPARHVHGQITTLKAASIHPILAGMPGDLGSALQLFRAIRSALGVANVNLHDTRRGNSYLALEQEDGGARRLLVHYAPATDELETMRTAMRRVARALRRLGAYVPPGLSRVLPKGASVHYSGTLPMASAAGEPFTVDAGCRSREFPNLFVVDGAVLPRLPAKNLTFTLMANAVRVAQAL